MKRDWVKKFILEEKSEVEGAHILRKVHNLFPFIPLFDIVRLFFVLFNLNLG